MKLRKKALAKHQVVVQEATEDKDIEQNLFQTVVGCGYGEIGTRIVIVNPKTLMLCDTNEVGEIWVSGKNVAQGYWNRPEETKETFQSYLADTGEGPFLRTGDLGFLKSGELFITGRFKELIIIHGQNYYPQDIEATIEKSHEAITTNSGAVFSIPEGGEERLIAVQEVKRTYIRKLNVDEVIKSIRQAISEQHEFSVCSISLLKPGQIPKTSSGKVQRHACRKQFLAGTFETVGQWEQPKVRENTASSITSSAVETADMATRDWLIGKIAQSTGTPLKEINPKDTFTYYGLSSLDLIGLSGELSERLGQSFPPTLCYDYHSIDALMKYLATLDGMLKPTIDEGNLGGGGAGRLHHL